MSLPFGIQTKGLVVGLVLGAVVVPRVVAAVSARSSK
jgi:hypothetical protein